MCVCVCVCVCVFVKKASGGEGEEKDYAGERRWGWEQIDPRRR